MPKARKTRSSQPPTTVGFRLEPEAMQVLVARAAQLHISPHRLAQRYVTEALTEAVERSVLLEKMNLLQDEVAASRGDLALATRAILRATDNLDDKEITEWVTKNLNLPCSRSPPQ